MYRAQHDSSCTEDHGASKRDVRAARRQRVCTTPLPRTLSCPSTQQSTSTAKERPHRKKQRRLKHPPRLMVAVPGAVVGLVCEYLGKAVQIGPLLESCQMEATPRILLAISCTNKAEARRWFEQNCECCGGDVGFRETTHLRALAGKGAAQRCTGRRLCLGCYAVEYPEVVTTADAFAVAHAHSLSTQPALVARLAEMLATKATRVPVPWNTETQSHAVDPKPSSLTTEFLTLYWVHELEGFLSSLKFPFRLVGRRYRDDIQHSPRTV
jgi:hypothetical protein